MSQTSGSLLLRAGVVRADQIAAAHRLRAREGGSFGECLVRTGAISEHELVEFYHKRLMIPRLPDGKLDHIPQRVLAFVHPDMAVEFRVIPVEIDGEGTVTLAMADPSDNHAVDEVAFFADRFVVRAVASESAIRRAVERYYGVTLTPEEPPPRRPPDPSPPPPSSKKEIFQKPTKEQLDEQIVLLTKVKHVDATPLPMPVPPPDDYVPTYAGEGTDEEPILLNQPIAQPDEIPEERPKRSTLPGFAAIVVPDPPLAQLRAARGRDEIATALLDYVAQMAGRVILFVVKKSLLVGNDARGEEPTLIKQLAINLDGPSLFRDVVASRLPYRGPLPETPANRGFAQAIGGVSSEILLMPVAIRDRIIAVLFADGASQPMPDAALHATTREAGLAYERLILESKGR
jgi:hypothetical protein